MNVCVRTIGMDVSEDLHSYATKRVRGMTRFGIHPAAQVSVRIVDENGPKGGIDKTCRICVQGPGLKVLSQARHTDPYAAVDLAWGSLVETIRRGERRRKTSTRNKRVARIGPEVLESEHVQ